MTRPIAQYRGPKDERKGTGLERPNTRLGRALEAADATQPVRGTMEGREQRAMEAYRRSRKAAPQLSDLQWRDETWMP